MDRAGLLETLLIVVPEEWKEKEKTFLAKLAEEMLEKFKEEQGDWKKKFSRVVWMLQKGIAIDEKNRRAWMSVGQWETLKELLGPVECPRRAGYRRPQTAL